MGMPDLSKISTVDLLAECAKILATEGHDIPAGFLAWLDGDEVMA